MIVKDLYGIRTTTSNPKMVRSSVFASHFAASLTSSRSRSTLQEIKSPEFRFSLSMGRDFKL